MVVELAVLRQGFDKLNGGGGGVGEGEGCALNVVLLPSLHPSIYRGKGAGPLQMDLEGGDGQGEGACPPSQGGRPI